MSENTCHKVSSPSLVPHISPSVVALCLNYIIYDDTDDDGIKSNCLEAVKMLLHKNFHKCDRIHTYICV